MKFTVYKTSDIAEKQTVEINTLDELLTLITDNPENKDKCPIIICDIAENPFRLESEGDFEIEIYNDYRE